MRYRIPFVLLAFLLAASPAPGQFTRHVSKVATTSASFLEIGAGARAVALGEAYVAAANDVSSIYWNPAGMAQLERPAAEFFHTPWVADIRYYFTAGVTPAGRNGWLGLFASSVTMDDEPVRTIQDPDGTGEYFSASSVALGLSYARLLTDRFSFGANIKFIREQIWHMSASALAFDLGTLFTTRGQNLKIGMSISNFGPKMKLAGRDTQVTHDIDENKSGNNDRISASLDTWEWSLPLLFRVGIHTQLLSFGQNQVSLALDAVHPNNDMEYINAGLEYSWNRIVYLRAGRSNIFLPDSETGLALGAGLHSRLGPNFSFRLDYVNRAFGIFGMVQGYSLSLTF